MGLTPALTASIECLEGEICMTTLMDAICLITTNADNKKHQHFSCPSHIEGTGQSALYNKLV